MSSARGSEVWIVGAKRTPFGEFAFGEFGGALKRHAAVDLGVFAAKAAVEQAGVRPEQVDEVVFGNVHQTAPDSVYLARHIGLRVGVRQAAPALVVNRMCGSGFEAIIQGARHIQTGEAEVVLVGGSEALSVSRRFTHGTSPDAGQGEPTRTRPTGEWDPEWANAMGKKKFGDMLWGSFTDSFAGVQQSETAENLAEKFGISREACDTYALRSHQRWAQANTEGRFQPEIVAVPVDSSSGARVLSADEPPKPRVSMQILSRLPAVFRQHGVVTMGNSAVLADGAAAMVLCSRAAGERLGLEPLARISSWGIVGCEPALMGIGSALAIRRGLERAGRALEEVDLFDINEAFAASNLAVEGELGIAPERSNVDGGAIALGHAFAASGVRITMHLAYELRRRKLQRGVGAACVGGGQGIAVVVEA